MRVTATQRANVAIAVAAAALVAGCSGAGIALARGAPGLAPLWIANALVVAALLRFPLLPDRVVLPAAAVGMVVANLLASMPLAVALGLTGANLLEVGAALFMMRRFGGGGLTYAPTYLFRFMLMAGIAAPLLGAFGGALLVLADDPQLSFGIVAFRWFAADALGMLVVGPLILTGMNPDCVQLLRGNRRWGEIALVAGVAALIAAIVFSQSRYPTLFVVLPVMTIAAFRLRFTGAAVSLLLIAAIAWFETMSGNGPIAGRLTDPAERILFLQMFLAVSVVSTLPIAAVLVERERLVRRLSESERGYRLLADHSNDMIVRIGLNGVRHYVSPASRTILGYEPEAMLGESPLTAIHAEDRARVERVCRSLLDGAENPTCAYRQRRSDGSYAELEASYRLVRDALGAPLELVASVRDIGGRKQAELETARTMARLEESHRLLQMSERIAGIGHWRLDAIDETLFWSEQVYHIHGRVPGDIPALNEAIEVYHPDDRPQVVEHVERALRDGEPWSFRARLVRPDGQVRKVESLGQPERGPDGRILGIFGVFRDVTDEAAAEAALIAARDEARALADAKSAFVATMSHEIRTPMTGVLGMIELLRHDPDPAGRARYLDNLQQSATLLMTVLDDVLDFSKIESGALQLEAIDFDLGALARSTLDLFSHAASSKGLTLSLALPVGRDLNVRGDPVRLRQIVANLVSNAVKFTQAGRIDLDVDVEARGDARIVRCRVADTGMGIDGETLGTLFQPFVQADASTTRRFGGTGLGLAITRRLVEAMGGEIGVTSRPGEGSMFSFTLPLGAPRDEAPAATAPERAAPHALSLLLAEDNAINRALVEALVRRDGHKVTSVENGRLAVEAAAATRFDAILMDMQMPEMDGLTATRTIRAGGGPNADTPIIALTADAAPERRRIYTDSGLTDLLTKPVDSAALFDRLRRIAPSTRPVPAPALAPALDAAKLNALAATIGEANVAHFLDMLAAEVASRPQAIARLIEIDSRVAAASEAHALAGAALNIGAIRIAEVARRIERACEAGAPLAPLASELLDAAAATGAAIERRRTQFGAAA